MHASCLIKGHRELLRLLCHACLAVFLPKIAPAQFAIVSTAPEQGAIRAQATAGITVTFTDFVDAATLKAGTIITGAYHGRYNFSAALDSTNKAARLLPSPAFIEGEPVTVIFTTAVASRDGAPLARPYRLAFRTATPQGNILTARDTISISLTPADRQPAKIAVGDFDEDDFPDAAVISSSSNTLTILLNTIRSTGIRGLTATNSYSTGATPIDLATADVDADGRLDLVVVNFTDNSAFIFWGRGDGSFEESPQQLAVGLRPSGIAVDDFDADGWPDLAVSLLGEDQVNLIKNVGGRQFSQIARLVCEAGTFGVAAADYDADGDADLAAINNGAQSVSFFRNDGINSWKPLSVQRVALRPVALKWGDISGATPNGVGDGMPELVVLSSNLTILGKQAAAAAADESEITIFSYDSGSEQFAPGRQIAYPNRAQDFDIASMDADLRSVRYEQDHDLDLLLADYMGNALQYLTNQDNEGWGANFFRLDRMLQTRTVVAADFDRDGDNDVLYASHLTNMLRMLVSPSGRCKQEIVIELDFGDVFVGTSLSRRLSLSPFGPLNVDASVSLTDQVNFSVSPDSLKFRDGRAETLTFTFSPQDTLHYESRVTFSTSYPLGECPITIILRGHGIDVDFNVVPLLLDFGTVPPTFSRTLGLLVTNNANGILQLTELRNTLPVFTHPAETLFVQPYGQLSLPVTFTPVVEGDYRDTLFIASNDIQKPSVSVVLIGKSASGKPRITSPDTVTAIEHQFFSYIATAEDPDGDQVTFRFSNLPGWLNAARDSVYGVPPEGARDTGFRIIATDGFLEDTLDVYVRVIPVNDPPRIADIGTITVTELQRMNVTVTATDPEGERLSLSAPRRPAWATFVDRGDNSGVLDGVPPFRSAGTDTVLFVARETVSRPALGDSLKTLIIIVRSKPDLSVAGLGVDRTNIKLNQTGTISARIVNERAPVLETFRITMNVDEATVLDTTVTGMEPGESFPIQATVTFDRLGNIPVTAEVDVDQVVPEEDETNNRMSINVPINRGTLLVRPNPFTPNGDGKNDVVVFDMHELAVRNPELEILTMQGKRIRTVTAVAGDQMQWDGFNESGDDILPGVYLYILRDGGRNVAQGYIVLAR